MAATNFEDIENGSIVTGKPSTMSLKRSESQGGSDSVSEAATKQTADLLLAETARDAERQGNWLTATGMIICCVIGVGVLGLPHVLSVLGWVAGLAAMVLFGGITWYTSILLADVSVQNGRRQPSYMDAVRTAMGDGHARFLAGLQYVNLCLIAIALNVVGAMSLQHTVCPAGDEGCSIKYWVFALIFGGIQLFVSQLPNLESVWWIAAIGSVMSFGYSIISIVLSAVYIGEYGLGGGSISGAPMPTADKVFGIFNAIGSILFAYSFSLIVVEIADTMKTDAKGPVWHMKRAVTVSIAVVATFYVLVSAMGYAAFGSATCGDILTCFGSTPTGEPSVIPSWVSRAINAMVLVHVIPAYSVLSQPVFEFSERTVRQSVTLRAWLPRRLTTTGFRLTFRSFYVAVAAVIAACMPFFTSIIGLVGACVYWPTSVLYPIQVYIRKHNITGARWWYLQSINIFCAAVTALAVVGSVRNIAQNASTYKFFA